MTTTIDARTLPADQRHADIFRTFDELPAGGRFVLVHDHDPKPLLRQFLSERRGQFEWSILEARSGAFRIEIEKRAAAGGRSVAEYLGTDHVRLDSIVAELEGRLDTGNLPAARARFDEFSCGLERHIQVEEQLLFPAFERSTGMVGGPVPVMCQEHALLRELLGRISDAIDAGDAGEARDLVDEVKVFLEPHNMKEEQIIYPRTDQALGEREREALVEQMLTL